MMDWTNNLQRPCFRLKSAGPQPPEDVSYSRGGGFKNCDEAVDPAVASSCRIQNSVIKNLATFVWTRHLLQFFFFFFFRGRARRAAALCSVAGNDPVLLMLFTHPPMVFCRSDLVPKACVHFIWNVWSVPLTWFGSGLSTQASDSFPHLQRYITGSKLKAEKSTLIYFIYFFACYGSVVEASHISHWLHGWYLQLFLFFNGPFPQPFSFQTVQRDMSCQMCSPRFPAALNLRYDANNYWPSRTTAESKYFISVQRQSKAKALIKPQSEGSSNVLVLYFVLFFAWVNKQFRRKSIVALGVQTSSWESLPQQV